MTSIEISEVIQEKLVEVKIYGELKPTEKSMIENLKIQGFEYVEVEEKPLKEIISLKLLEAIGNAEVLKILKKLDIKIKGKISDLIVQIYKIDDYDEDEFKKDFIEELIKLNTSRIEGNFQILAPEDPKDFYAKEIFIR